MKIIKFTICFAFVLGSFVSVKAEEINYWKPIRDAWEVKNNPNIGFKTQAYIESLSPEQLIIAGRQCAEEFNSEFHRNGFSEGTGFLIGFFIYQYPKTTGLKDLSPIFKDIEDANQTDMWRSSLIHAFYDNWSQKLSDNQLRDVANNIDQILEKRNLYYRVTNESLYATREMIQEIENRNMKDVNSSNDVNASNDKDQENKKKEITDYYTRFSHRLINISNDSNINSEEQMVSFGLMRDIFDKPIGNREEVKNTLNNAVRNFEKYDVKTWRILSQIGINNLQMPDANQITKIMADKLEQRINNEPNNSSLKISLQSELRSIKRNTKKE